MVSAYIRPAPESDQTYIKQRDSRIAATARMLCHAFDPWARSTDDGRLQSIISIMQRASELGILLLSQPASFEWYWETPGAARTTLVLPGLRKTTDENARPLKSPILLIMPRTVGEKD